MDTPERHAEESDLAARVKSLERSMKRLRISDRNQSRKLREQQRWGMIFAGVIAAGAALSTNSLSPENRASIENMATGLAVMLAGGLGVAGVSSGKFKPPGQEDEDDYDDDYDDEV